MTLQRQAFFWFVALAALCLFLWVFRGILAPFLAGIALAYFLDPVADRLEKLKFSRFWAAVTIVGLFLIAFTIVVVLITPPLVAQILGFINRIPELIGQFENFLANSGIVKWLGELIPIATPDGLQSSMTDVMRQGSEWIGAVFGQILSGGQAIVGLLSFLLISPIIAFYLLWDWDNLVDRVDKLLPRDHAQTIRRLAREIDDALSGFVRGQITVAMLLGAFYAITLSLMGLNFGLLIGIVAGVINIIPYVGSIVGFVIAVGVATLQFWPDWTWILAVAAVFVVGQVVEGNGLQPLLVGEKVGLHPVWLMFGIIAFSSLFGLAGTLIAVPAAAAIGVLVRFAIAQYLDSAVYRGTRGRTHLDDDAPAGRTGSKT